MKIAAANSEDLEAVLRLERGVPEAPHWAAAAYLAIVRQPEGSTRRCLLICQQQADLCGFAVGRIVAGDAELESVVVRDSARRGGVGRALCAAVLAWAWEQGAESVELEVRASSLGARALYGQLGFVEVGQRSRYYREPAEDAVLMRLKRTAGAM